jgi:hypothetical protein
MSVNNLITKASLLKYSPETLLLVSGFNKTSQHQFVKTGLFVFIDEASKTPCAKQSYGIIVKAEKSCSHLITESLHLCDMVRENSVNVSGVLDHILEIS